MADTRGCAPSEERRSALDRLEILDALAAAVDRRDEVVRIVGEAATAGEARSRVAAVLKLNEVQATAVLDLQIRRFSAEQRQRIHHEREEMLRLSR